MNFFFNFIKKIFLEAAKKTVVVVWVLQHLQALLLEILQYQLVEVGVQQVVVQSLQQNLELHNKNLLGQNFLDLVRKN